MAFSVGFTWTPFQNHTYYVNRDENSSECEARAACAAEDAYLVRVDSDEEWDFLLDLVNSIFNLVPGIRLDITNTGDLSYLGNLYH